MTRFSVPRRQLLTVSAAVSLAGLAGTAELRAQGARRDTLVAYFSRTGNTRVLARQIRRARDAELFEILPVDDYPEDYEQTVAQAARERESRYEPALKASVQNLATYSTVYLGFPIWGQSVPAVVRTFLSRHDLAGKTLIPFITHGGYGPGDSQAVLAAHAPKARVRDAGLVLKADQERETLAQVTRWLGGIRGAN
ncbi:flavodoxin [Ottowia thiooxydans]|uniref:flavodoxin n=1 Tax=Ottowia thiooxydans TaxID=219182 RepID=UPI00041C2F2C|nr:flavodoxin [Ottowia thiooxydans]